MKTACAGGRLLATFVSLAVSCLAQTPGYTISTVAGSGTPGSSGDGGVATEAQLNNPTGVAVDAAFTIYIADQLNQVIRQVQGSNITTLAGDGRQGLFGDGGSAGAASFYSPAGVAVASNGDYYIADYGNSSIRKVSQGRISTFAGSSSASADFGGDGGPAASALLNLPKGVAVDASGNVYIADSGNNRIRKVDTAGKIATVAGGGTTSLGDLGQATRARLSNPQSVAVDAAGNIYIADTGQNRIRKVDANGIITTIAGTGTAGFTGDGGPGAIATLSSPRGVAVDAAGNVFFSDYNNYRIRRVAANGTISTIAGNGQAGWTGDGGPATGARLRQPTGLAVDSAGRIYIADTANNVVRKLTPLLPTIGGVITAGAFGAFQSTVAPGTWIEIYGSAFAGGSRGWAEADFTGSTAPASLDGTAVTIGGQPAFVDYISPGQVNALVPSNVPLGQQPVTVRSLVGTSDPFTVTVNAAQPGMLAPPQFKINGKQYVAALFSDNTTFAVPAGAVGGATSRAAKPGDIVIIYGVGFGPVIPATPAGQPAPSNTSLSSPLEVFFGGTPATLQYWGLSPGSYGLYQFNVVVPSVPANDATPLTFKLAGVNGPQTLYIAIAN